MEICKTMHGYSNNLFNINLYMARWISRMNSERTLIKLSTIIGFPYLFARSSKCNLVAWQVGSYLCTGVEQEISVRRCSFVTLYIILHITMKLKDKILKCIKSHLSLRIISGLGLNLEASCDQKRGIDPRICTTELILPLHDPASSSRTICSVSTSFATLPQSFTPLFKYLQQINKPHYKSSYSDKKCKFFHICFFVKINHLSISFFHIFPQQEKQ